MDKISANDLAKLIEGGFIGEVKFRGRVFGRIEGVHPLEASNNFYYARGKFSLSRPVSGAKGCYDLRMEGELNESEQRFRFKIREEGTIHYTYEERYGSIIQMSITLAEKATLQIEPEEILF